MINCLSKPSINMFVICLITFFTISSAQTKSFLRKQKEYSRVREAYVEKDSLIRKHISQYNITHSTLNILIIAYKGEKELELWVKKKSEKRYFLLNTYPICNTSGTLGPKRKEWDLQIPEGFYHIAAFNPTSRYFLSFCINYPNRSDKILSPHLNPGDNICIHGSCATIGCLPMDDFIKEIYIYAIEAKNNGQNRIPVYVFPMRLNEKNYNQLREKYKDDIVLLEFWKNLKEGYDKFQSSKEELRININRRGKYIFN